MRLERIFIASVAAGAASPIVLHALWRPLGAAAGVFAAVPAPLLSAVAGLIPLICGVVFAALAHHPAGARAAQGAAFLLTGAAAIALGAPRGAQLPLVPPLAAVFALSGFGLPWVARRLPASLDGAARRRRVASGLWAALGLVVIVEAARLSTFMADPAVTSASTRPNSLALVRHACVVAYLNAAELTRQGVANVYDEALSARDPLGPNPPSAIDPGPFTLDAYEYPPPFLLLPRLALAFTQDVLILRSVWFALQAGLLALALLRLARWIGGEEGKLVALLAPVVWVSFPSFIGLQMGNFQIAAISMAVLAMVAFEEDRPATGGALLAFCVVSKLSPGLLVVYLLARRRLREVAWVSGFALFYTVASLAVLGPQPFIAFITYNLPRIASGEAFSFMNELIGPFLGNYSVFAIPLKLERLGVPGMSSSVASTLAWVYTLLALGLAALAARRFEGRRLKACAWLTLLSLGALRSPFAPAYVLVTTQWLLTLLAPEARGRRPLVAALVASWLVVSVLVRPPGLTAAICFSLLAQAASLTLLFWSVLRRPGSTGGEPRRIEAAGSS